MKIIKELGWVCNSTLDEGSQCYEVCGNGIPTPREACDDGNEVDGDGCYNCIVTDGWRCVSDGSSPSVCSEVPTAVTNDESSDFTLVIAIPTAVGVAAIGAAIILLVVFKNRNKRKVAKKPNFAEIAFGSDGNAEPIESPSSEKRKKMGELEQVI